VTTVKKPNIRKCLEDYLEPYDGSFAVLLSSGLDSHAVFFSLLALKKKVTVYSFTLDDRESRDFKIARETARIYGVPFKPIYLPTDIDVIKRDLLHVVNDIGANGKAAIECIWALHYAVRSVKEKYIVSGLAADLFFVLSKKGCMHYKDCPDDYRIPRFKSVKGPTSQTSKLKAYSKHNGKIWLSPWLSNAMMAEFKGTSWDDVNKPKQKQPLRTQYAKFIAMTRVYNHTDLQLGDSGIAEQFKRLLTDTKDWNRWNYKSLSGIYGKLVKGEITK
jgi:asparagine synthetase B (glutamine-hydrolysing)